MNNTCSLCNSTYVRTTDLKRHLKSKHVQQKCTLKQQQTYNPEQQQQPYTLTPRAVAAATAIHVYPRSSAAAIHVYPRAAAAAAMHVYPRAARNTMEDRRTLLHDTNQQSLHILRSR